MTLKLPIFPLNTVLFPGAPLRLHIFEERYRLMIGRCMEQHTPFGVVLLRAGGEISPDDPWVRQQIAGAGGGEAELSALRRQLGGDAVPHAVGTTAQISTSDSVRLDDGRYYIGALGQRRFQIQYLAQRQPYLIASVSFLSEEGSPNSLAVADELRALYARYWAAAGAATGAEKPAEIMPEQAVELSYWMAHRLQVDNLQKQRWLESDLTSRLRAMCAALRTELAMFPGSRPGERERGSSWN
jgi:Lon protease-like protein